jgi:hypothetical protein
MTPIGLHSKLYFVVLSGSSADRSFSVVAEAQEGIRKDTVCKDAWRDLYTKKSANHWRANESDSARMDDLLVLRCRTLLHRSASIRNCSLSGANEFSSESSFLRSVVRSDQNIGCYSR